MFEDFRISALDFGAMSDEGLIGALRTAHGVLARAQAAQVFAARELYRRRRAENVRPGHNGVRAGEFAATEVALALHTDEATAGLLIDTGLALEERLPGTRRAFAAGRIDVAAVRVIVEGTRSLPKAAVAELEPGLLEVAGRTTPALLRQAVQRWVARVDPEGARQRREHGQAGRDVRIRAVHDGMAVFDGLLGAVGAQTVAMRLREMSLRVCARDPRSMSQRRADALVALADGSGRLRCACGRGQRCPVAREPHHPPRAPLVRIGVSADTLTGAADDPAFLAGYGPIDAALVRQLAGNARRRIDSHGCPGDAWGTCRFPGCVEPVQDTEPLQRAEPVRGIESGRDAEPLADGLGFPLSRSDSPPWGNPPDVGVPDSVPAHHAVPDRPSRGNRDDRPERDGTPVPATSAARRRGPSPRYPAALCPRHRRAEVERGSWRRDDEPDGWMWRIPTGEGHPSIPGTRHRPADEAGPSDERTEHRHDPGDDAARYRPTAEELCEPLTGHRPVHPQLDRIAPEDDLPDPFEDGRR